MRYKTINGNGTAPNLAGMFQRLTNPSAPGATVAAFDDFVTAFAGGIDGLWANTIKEVAIVAGVDTYRRSAQTFRDDRRPGRQGFRRLRDDEFWRLVDE